nr:hypothetical protein HAGR004_32650 [Bdellovibrio sp. HAGR004]
MKLKYVLLALSLSFLVACGQESKVRSAAKEVIEKSYYDQMAKTYKGSEKSKVWTEYVNLVNSKFKVEIVEVKVDGNKAEGVAKVTTAEDKTAGGLAVLLMFAAEGMDKKGQTLAQGWEELRAQDKRTPAMSDFPTETKEVHFTAVKEDTWKVTAKKPLAKNTKGPKNK